MAKKHLEPAHRGQHADAQLVGQIQVYQGPLPPPAELAAYEQAQSGAADRILAMAERDQLAVIRDQRLARIIGFVLDLLSHAFLYGLVVAAVYLAINDKPLEAFFTGLAPIAIAIYANTRKKPSDEHDKQ
jgi:uncharacterized membrane protein